MKNLLLLITCLGIHLTVLCQNVVTPLELSESKDSTKAHCFTTEQLKAIIKELITGDSMDSIATAYATRDEVFQKLVAEKDHRLDLEKKHNDNLRQQIGLKDEQMVGRD